MSASLPVHTATSLETWKLVETAFGLNRQGVALSRPHRHSWLAQIKKHVPRQEAAAMTKAWMLRLFWLRRMEHWLIETHQDSSYAFLDMEHLESLADLQYLLEEVIMEKNARSSDILRRFPLLPKLPAPVWFSAVQVFDISIGKGLKVLQELGPKELEDFGKHCESPDIQAAIAASAFGGDVTELLNPFVLDGSLEAGYLEASLKNHIPEEAYRVSAGPGGYKRELPALQKQWESAMQACHEQVTTLFALAPDALRADQWQYYLGLSCVKALHVCRGEEGVVSALPPFHRQVRLGEGLRSSLDTRLPIESLLPDQPARLGIWRTALGRFHHAGTVGEREEARRLLSDLPRHFCAPLRPEGPAWRHLQKLLKLAQQSQTLFTTEPATENLQEHIEQARLAFRKSNLLAFEWRYAFPEVLDPQTASFQGFGSIQLLLPEQMLQQQEHLLLAWVQLAWKLLKPGGRLQLWLPDNVMRLRNTQPAFQWMARTGSILETRYCGGERFDAEITGKQIVVWEKNG